MPLPWKKVKSTRISQLVNDHLHISQKRRDGSSLVVATGFPTSLIDLFIKNREKLKNPSRRKRRSQPIAQSDDVYDPLFECGSPDYCPYPPPPSLVATPSPQRQASVLPPPSGCGNEIRALQSSGDGSAAGGADEDQRSGGERGRDVNGVLLGVSKVFVVVVLALATKRLTVAITISAVLLLLLECVGKYCGVLSKPFAAATSMLRSAGRLIKYKKVEEKKQERLIKSVSLPMKSSASSCQEIEVVGSKVCSTAVMEEIQPEVETVEGSHSRYQEIELVEMEMKREESLYDVAPVLKRKSRKARIKSHMNKIVPRKFRGSKKHHDLQIVKDDSFIMPEEHCNNGEEYENGSITSSISDGGYREDDVKNVICSDRRLSQVEEKGEIVAARRYILLCLIVLVGLIGGRAFALVLTLIWFLLLKLGQKLPRSIKLPCL